jgi:hypothetical protein
MRIDNRHMFLPADSEFVGDDIVEIDGQEEVPRPEDSTDGVAEA